jgi:hypothetical protein
MSTRRRMSKEDECEDEHKEECEEEHEEECEEEHEEGDD